jgi:hypothetical protein
VAPERRPASLRREPATKCRRSTPYPLSPGRAV